MTSIKDMVKDNFVSFTHYHDGDLWYELEYYDEFEDTVKFAFPVPISDIGGATFHAGDRAMLFMRYIRAQMKVLAAKETA